MTQQPTKHRRPSPWQVIKSILAAAFGVQSEEARQRDFEHGNPVVFIVGGLLFTILFVIVLVVIVNMVV